MTTLMQASRQWATRPADERFLSLLELQAFTHRQLNNSRSSVFSSLHEPDSLDAGADIDLGHAVGIAGKAHFVAGKSGLAGWITSTGEPRQATVACRSRG